MNKIMSFAWLLGIAAAASGQDSAPSWGTDSESSVTVTAWQMTPIDSGTTWASDSATGHRYATISTFFGLFVGSADLPNGAQITRIEMEACDDSIEGEATGGIFLDGPLAPLASVATDVEDTPGCGRFQTGVAGPPVIVDNDAHRYLVSLSNTAYEGSVTLGALRVYYRLRVSPAPGAATFVDVPVVHPFFQFVEALAASGITAGCGSGNYCPDSPLTRGQMAVFLAKALGLHFPAASGPPPLR